MAPELGRQAPGTLLDLLHELVAVHRLALEQVQHRVADVAATRPALPLAPARRAEASPRSTAPRPAGAEALRAEGSVVALPEDLPEQAVRAEDLVVQVAETEVAAPALLSRRHGVSFRVDGCASVDLRRHNVIPKTNKMCRDMSTIYRKMTTACMTVRNLT